MDRFFNAGSDIDAMEAVGELRDIAGVLSITANTDRNIKESMESIFRIADRLERKGNAKEAAADGEEVHAKGGIGKAPYRDDD